MRCPHVSNCGSVCLRTGENETAQHMGSSGLEAHGPQGMGTGLQEPEPEAAQQPHNRPALSPSSPQQEEAKHPRGKVSLSPHSTQQLCRLSPGTQPDPKGLLLPPCLSTHSHQNAKHSLAPIHTSSQPHHSPSHTTPSLSPHLCSHRQGALPGKHGRPPRSCGRWVNRRQ